VNHGVHKLVGPNIRRKRAYVHDKKWWEYLEYCCPPYVTQPLCGP
jgi:hypothetical protein